MYTKEVKIINEVGLHARPASKFVKIANKFKSDIKVSCEGKSGFAKSILNIMALGAHKDSVLEITAEGVDEVKAVDALVAFVANKCEE